MTYPQYPQPPQAYAPAAPTYPQYPQPPQAAPAAPAPQVPTYPQFSGASAVQQPPASAPQGQAIAPPVPQLRDGGGGGGAVSPKMRHLVGRTIIVEPISIGTTEVKGKEQDEARFHLTVVDGGPLRYGDNVDDRDPSKNRPCTHEIDVPARFTNATDIGFGFVQAVRDALDAGEPGRVGVVQQGQKGNRPYLITKCGVDVDGNERPDGEARFAAAMEVFGKIWNDRHSSPNAPRQFVNPEPRSLVAPPPAGAAAVNYGYPQSPAPAAAQPAYPGVPAYPGAAPAPQTYGYAGAPAGYPMQPDAAAAYVAQIPMPQPAAAAQPPAYGGIPQQPYGPPASAPPASPAPGVAPNGYYMPGQPAAPAAYPAPAQPSAYAAAMAPELQAMAQQVPPQVEAWLASLPADQAAGARAQYLAQTAAAAPAGPGI